MISSIKAPLCGKGFCYFFSLLIRIRWIRKTMAGGKEWLHLQSNDKTDRENQKQQSPQRLLKSRHLVMHNSCLLKAWQFCDDENFLQSFTFWALNSPKVLIRNKHTIQLLLQRVKNISLFFIFIFLCSFLRVTTGLDYKCSRSRHHSLIGS